MSKFYVTTAIPYVNAEPHIGHAMLHLYADVLARYHRQIGDEVLFSSGTDEHGGKIAEKAAEQGITPKQFADQVSVHFRDLLKMLNISNDRFIRTTDEAHEKRCQLIWQKLEPYIYKGHYSGWYCVGHEEYFPEATVKANSGVCPDHNRKYEQLTEENYFFKLSAFTEKLKELIDNDTLKVITPNRKNEIMSLINSGLDDISISRPQEKIAWGIAVPGDVNQVMYVWFEALMNYITVLGYPEHPDFEKFWPADVQVIGKDILRFHAAIWPAMLIGLGLEPEKVLYAHGLIMSDGKKMSKTLGNVVSPSDIVAKYGVDTFRYFFLRHMPSYEDGDFTWARLDAAYNDELADQLGNAVSRTAAMITRYQKGMIGDIPSAEHDLAGYADAITECRFDRALDIIWEQVKGLNQYIDETKPWVIAKTNDETHLREVLAYASASLLQIAQLIEPFMPDTSAKIKDVFGTGLLKPLAGSLFPKQEKPPVQPAA